MHVIIIMNFGSRPKTSLTRHPALTVSSLVSFGCCVNPCGKDQDRLDFRKIKCKNAEAIYCAAVYDGHGVSASVVNLAEQTMLSLVETEFQQTGRSGLEDLDDKVKRRR